MDSNETMFVTGSADGDIKVDRLMQSFVNAHLFLDAGVGFDLSESDPVLPSGTLEAWALQKHKPRSGSGLVLLNIIDTLCLFVQVSLDDGTLYSCGADGSMKMRRLPERDVYVNVRDF